LNYKSAEIGIILIASNIPAFFFLSLGLWPLFQELHLFRVISEWGLFLILCVGLAFYIWGRKEFWNRVEHRKVSILLVILGPVLTVLGVRFSFSIYNVSLYLASKPSGRPFSVELANNFSALIWFILWIMSGIVLLYDGYKQARKVNGNENKL
jgi:membrane-associated HD superfamily phosphohydrolase